MFRPLNDVLPAFAVELHELILKTERADLAEQVNRLEIFERCRCEDEFCSSFYTVPKPNGAWGAGHSNLALSPDKGMVVLDLIDDRICYVEVIDRDDVREAFTSFKQ